MATYSKIPLSQSANGRSIMLTASAAPYTLIHTTGSLSANTDEIWLYAVNNSTADALITLYWGSSATADLLAPIVIQAYAGAALLIPGFILTGTGSAGTTVYATVATPSAVEIIGYVNRITA
jgi:hypothetical protein